MKRIVCILALLWAGAAHGQILPFEWNAKKAEVKVRHKGKPVETPSTLTYDSVWINKQSMKVAYGFTAGKLNKVTFTMIRPAADTSAVHKQADYFAEDMYSRLKIDAEEERDKMVNLRFTSSHTKSVLNLNFDTDRYILIAIYAANQ